MNDWMIIKREYVYGDESYRRIAERHGISRYAVAERGKSEEWPRLRRERKVAEADKEGLLAEGEKNEEMIRLIAEKMLEKISDGIASGEISVSGANIRQLTATVKDIMDILGVMTPAEAEEHCARVERMKREIECDRTVSVVFGDADEFCE